MGGGFVLLWLTAILFSRPANTTETSEWYVTPAESRRGSSSEGNAKLNVLTAATSRAITPYEWDITPTYHRNNRDGSGGDIVFSARICHLLWTPHPTQQSSGRICHLLWTSHHAWRSSTRICHLLWMPHPALNSSPCLERLNLLSTPPPALNASPCFERLTMLWTSLPALNGSPCFECLTMLWMPLPVLNTSPCFERLSLLWTPHLPGPEVLLRCLKLHSVTFLYPCVGSFSKQWTITIKFDPTKSNYNRTTTLQKNRSS